MLLRVLHGRRLRRGLRVRGRELLCPPADVRSGRVHVRVPGLVPLRAGYARYRHLHQRRLHLHLRVSEFRT